MDIEYKVNESNLLEVKLDGKKRFMIYVNQSKKLP